MLGSPLVLGGNGHSLELVKVANEIKLFRSIPNLFLLLDDELISFRDQQNGEEDKDGSVSEDEVGGGECSWQEDVVTREEEDDGRADEQYPA